MIPAGGMSGGYSASSSASGQVGDTGSTVGGFHFTTNKPAFDFENPVTLAIVAGVVVLVVAIVAGGRRRR